MPLPLARCLGLPGAHDPRWLLVSLPLLVANDLILRFLPPRAHLCIHFASVIPLINYSDPPDCSGRIKLTGRNPPMIELQSSHHSLRIYVAKLIPRLHRDYAQTVERANGASYCRYYPPPHSPVFLLYSCPLSRSPNPYSVSDWSTAFHSRSPDINGVGCGNGSS